MLFVIISFILGYGISFGRIKYKEYMEQKENRELSFQDPQEEIKEETLSLNIDNFLDTIEKSSGQEWYVNETENFWSLFSQEEDNQEDVPLLHVPKIDGMIWPSKEDTDFIVSAKNEIIPELLNELIRLNEKNDQIMLYTEQALFNEKATKEDYRKILDTIHKL